jgi:hypothetical protein
MSFFSKATLLVELELEEAAPSFVQETNTSELKVRTNKKGIVFFIKSFLKLNKKTSFSSSFEYKRWEFARKRKVEFVNFKTDCRRCQKGWGFAVIFGIGWLFAGDIDCPL